MISRISRSDPRPSLAFAIAIVLVAVCSLGLLARDAGAQTVVATDDFDRPDEVPFAVGANWLKSAGAGTAQLVGNQVAGVSGEAVHTWQGPGVFDDARQFARARVVQATAGEVGLSLLGSSGQAIVVAWQRTANQVLIFSYVGGIAQPTLLAAPSTIQVGDIVEAEVLDGTIYAKVNGAVVASAANTTSIASGKPGFQTFLTGGILDDWVAGNSTAYSVSGTILEGGIGLAGVLVRASGPFSGTTTTNAGGGYTLASVPSGASAIVLTPNLVGQTMSPSTRTVSGPVVADVLNEDFTSTASNNPIVAFDDFDRGVEIPLVVGGNWQKVAGTGSANLSGNQIVGLGPDAVYSWQGPGTFDAARQFARARVTQTTGQVGLALLTANGQAIVAAWDQSLTILHIYWYSGGVNQGNLATVSSTVQAGDILEAELQGGAIYAKVNGAVVASALNTTSLTSGRPGFEVFRVDGKLDDWQAGTPTDYDVSGTITESGLGLAGVLVRASGEFGGLTTTDSNGQYAFAGVPSGVPSIAIRPNLAGHTMAPLTRTIAGPILGDVALQDFTSLPSNNAVIAFDDFDRPAEVQIAAGGAWLKAAGTGSAGLADRRIIGVGGESVYAWQGPGSFDDTRQYARARVVQATGQLGLALLAGAGHAVVAAWDTATATVRITWFSGGTVQGTLNTLPSTIQAGDVLEAELLEGRIYAKVNGIVVASAVNTTSLDSGRPGFQTALAGGQLDDWEAGTPSTFTLSGRISEGAVGLAGIVVTASGKFGGLTTTDGNGDFLFTGVPAGATSILLTPRAVGYSVAPIARSVTGPVAANVSSLDFTATPSSNPFVAADDFERPAEVPLQTGTLWQKVAGAGSASLTNNEILGLGADAVYAWQGPGSFDAGRQYARARVVATTGQIGLALLGDAGQGLVAAWDDSISTLYVYWYAGGVIQGNLATIASSIEPGDTIEFELLAGTMYAKVNGTVVASVANTTSLSSGRPGFETFRAGGRIDDWQAGTPPEYTLSGIITESAAGLSGVLVRASGHFGGTATTDGNGQYTLYGVAGGTTAILLTPNLAGHTMSPSTRTVDGPIIGSLTGIDFTSTPSNNPVVAADDFNRPDELPLLTGGNWQKVAGAGSANLASDEIVGIGADAVYAWQGPGIFDATRQYARARVTNTTGQVGLALLGASGQAIVAAWNSGASTFYLYWYMGGAIQGNLATLTATIQVGDLLEAELLDGTISAKVNGTVLASAANTTPLATGRPGFETFLAGGRLDDWEAGIVRVACEDGLDNDGDGLADLADPGCTDPDDLSEQNPAIACDDGLDNDGDTLIDLVDPGCSGPADPSELDLVVACNDGADNDGDGLIDLADPGCASATDASEQNAAIACDDGADNDGDGLIDVADPGCADANDASEQNAAIACDDGADNDGDSLIDLTDPGCADPNDASEQNATIACDDGSDNDGDGLIDLVDPGCADGADASEQNASVACDDGVDNDGDLLVDWPADPGCDSAMDTSEGDAAPAVPMLPPSGWLVLAGALIATARAAAKRGQPEAISRTS